MNDDTRRRAIQDIILRFANGYASPHRTAVISSDVAAEIEALFALPSPDDKAGTFAEGYEACRQDAMQMIQAKYDNPGRDKMSPHEKRVLVTPGDIEKLAPKEPPATETRCTCPSVWESKDKHYLKCPMWKPAPTESAQPTDKFKLGAAIKHVESLNAVARAVIYKDEPPTEPASGVSERRVTDPVPCGCEINECACCGGCGVEGVHYPCKPCGGQGKYIDDTLCKYRATAPPAASVGDAPIREVIRCLDGIRARIDNHWYLPGEVAPELKRVIAKLEAALPGAVEKEASHGER